MPLTGINLATQLSDQSMLAEHEAAFLSVQAVQVVPTNRLASKQEVQALELVGEQALQESSQRMMLPELSKE